LINTTTMTVDGLTDVGEWFVSAEPMTAHLATSSSVLPGW
jgi:hypothetical protein